MFRKRKTVLLLLVLALSALLLISGCSGKQENGSTHQEKEVNLTKVKIGYFPNITHASAIVGVEKGLFQDELCDVELETQLFPNGSLLMDALLTGQIDVGFVGPEPVINRYLQGADVVVLAGAASGGNVIVAGKDSGVETIADLKNKVTATPAIGCTHDIELRALMDREGLKMESEGGQVSHRTQKPALMMNLLEQQQLDAVAVSEPWASQMEEKLGAKVIVDWDEMPWAGKLPATLLVSSRKFAEENPEVIKRILKGHVASVEAIQSDPEMAMTMVQKQIKDLTKSELSQEVIRRAFARTKIEYSLEPKILNELVEKTADLGLIKGSTDLSGLIDITALNQALEEIKSKEGS